jgi:hypothetical protein
MWEEAKEEVRNSSKDSSVYIGCDSIRFKKNDEWYARYATVVVVHRDSRHGCRIFYDIQILRDYGQGAQGLKNRLLMETNYALEAATQITEVLGDRPLEIHLDLNNDPKHKSNVAVSEAVGWVLGMGFKPVIKPHGWAASHAADHCVRFKSFATG